jgi:hypothetical protein
MSYWRGVESHEGFPNAAKSQLLLWSLSHEGIAHSPMVELKVLDPHKFSTGKITSRMPLGDPSCLGFPTNPGVTKKLDELNGE